MNLLVFFMLSLLVEKMTCLMEGFYAIFWGTMATLGPWQSWIFAIYSLVWARTHGTRGGSICIKGFGEEVP